MTDKNRLAWRSLPPQDAATGVPRKTSAFLRVDQVENGHGRNRRLFHGLWGPAVGFWARAGAGRASARRRPLRRHRV